MYMYMYYNINHMKGFRLLPLHEHIHVDLLFFFIVHVKDMRFACMDVHVLLVSGRKDFGPFLIHKWFDKERRFV